MNKPYFLLLLFAALFSAPLVSQAQLSGADSLRLRLNAIFQPLDKSQVPTGYLEEYGVRLLPLANYNGTLTDSSLCDLATLRYLRASLASARIYGPDTLPTMPACALPWSAATSKYKYFILLI
ncbi:MAG: hypothetical protein EOO63_10320 [Hymenobacter sp.]|nr:MAG: hypothetical protein EOO63_10320 [Hymenobacter sp.]